MFAICVEASHKKGMGHLFRMLNFINLLKERNEEFVVLINNDAVSIEILSNRKLPFYVVNLFDFTSDWESSIIKEYNIDIWINDRLETSAAHADNVKNNDVILITIDDFGDGAAYSDIHFAMMPCVFESNPKGKNVYAGIEYIILNKEIEKHRKQRNSCDKILVTMGGSDTHGVTIKIVKLLLAQSKSADIVIGPSFKHEPELLSIINNDFQISRNVPSLIELFDDYDLAITGGGITPFEANACGLPCIIIASEIHEVDNGKYLDNLGSSVYAGHHSYINEAIFTNELAVEDMSKKGLNMLNTLGAQKIYNTIHKEIK